MLKLDLFKLVLEKMSGLDDQRSVVVFSRRRLVSSGRGGLRAYGGGRQLPSLAQCRFHIWSSNHGNLYVPKLKTDQTPHKRVKEGDAAAYKCHTAREHYNRIYFERK